MPKLVMYLLALTILVVSKVYTGVKLLLDTFYFAFYW